jgi:hypothetical protein
MMTYEEFVEKKHKSFKSSEYKPMGLSALLSLPTITGFIAYGVTLGALVLAPYFTFKTIAFVTPVFVASVIGGSIGLFIGAVMILYILPLLAIGMRMLADFLVNGNMAYQYLKYCSKYIAGHELEKLQVIYTLLSDLVNRNIVREESITAFERQAGLTETQKEIFKHICELHEHFTAEELSTRQKQNKRIINLKSARAREWLSAERSLRYQALHAPDDQIDADTRLSLLDIADGFNMLDVIYYFMSFYRSSYDYRTHPMPIRIDFSALAQLNNNPLFLNYSTDPIKLLLSLSTIELKQLSDDLVAKNSRYQSMSYRKIETVLSLLAGLQQRFPDDPNYRYEYNYCERIYSHTKFWAEQISDEEDRPIREMALDELKAKRTCLIDEENVASHANRGLVRFQRMRLDSMIKEAEPVTEPEALVWNF